ncbi:hypothetical protein [Streptomyces fragilis]|uniref:Uncharacterized protein n=1 Tax=Streptomyces fragilis TaxID=67301 RepID=A0ABV2YJX9_9ACTN|nr:hypothetical protein [Streptomyces fragilis]
MADIPGARAELDRLGRDLRAQLASLVQTLTPGADLDSLVLREPAVVDWHEPLGYRYSLSFRGHRPAGIAAAGIVPRAARLLARAGWDVPEPEEYAELEWATDDTGDRYLLTARHPDGNLIEVRVDAYGSAVLFIGRTPVTALYEAQAFRWPEPVRTAAALTPGHLLCYECDGLGACDCCGGRGWLPSEPHGRSRCPQCAARRVCPVCGGAGELALSQLSAYQRTYYPELGRP